MSTQPSLSPAESDSAIYATARESLVKLLSANDLQSSCLSVEPHDLRDIRDLRCHFFGCLGINRRLQVLANAADPIWAQAEALEIKDTEPVQKNNSKTPPIGSIDPDEYQPSMRYVTALSLQAELKRISVLRRTPALRGLVREVQRSLVAWREENRKNIDDVERLRIDTTHFRLMLPPETPRSPRQPGTRRAVASPSQDPGPPVTRERRRTTNLTQGSLTEHDDFSRMLKKIVDEEREKNNEDMPEDDPMTCYELKRDIKAQLILLERPKPSDSKTIPIMGNVMEPDWEDVGDEIFKGRFPDQQVSMFHLLDGALKGGQFNRGKFERTPKKTLEDEICPRKLRYYHIPVNNMLWAEQAIASYFNEPHPEPGQDFDPSTKMVLRDDCWRGQEHGNEPHSMVHNRHLRPMCEKISTDPDDAYHKGESSLVLFMPFLHWETDRRRDQAANLIERLADEHELDLRETAHMWKEIRKDNRKGLLKLSPPVAAPKSSDYKEPNYYKTRGEDRDQILQALAKILWEKIRKDSTRPMPSGLPHTLWQRIRDEAFEDALIRALKNALLEKARIQEIPQILQKFISNQGVDEKEQPIYDWDNTFWRIKEAGKGYPTPHTLEDIFWEEIKKARKIADTRRGLKGESDEDVGEIPGENVDGYQSHSAFSGKDGSSRKIFQSPTTIFKGVKVDEYGYPRPKNRLAKVLIKAARLYEQMTTYPDQRIMEKDLFSDPPLHPRRTLDQAYFWRLRTTRSRDRDQVVYRHTNAEFAHKYRPHDTVHTGSRKPMSSTNSKSRPASDQSDITEAENWQWSRHGQFEDEYGCAQCDADIRKVSRAVMVDQLWMWVLDKDTILTCFPQRYGMSYKDDSGVHQSIRTRVKTRSNPDNHVRSIFDLALIILDECFNTFFDRARTADQRPQVIDMFSESIGRVTHKQAVAFRHLWSLSERLTAFYQIGVEEKVDPAIYQSGVEDEVDPRIMLALLNVTPEAELQREIRDIIDELNIMLHIVGQQQEVIKRFVRFAEEILRSTKSNPTKSLGQAVSATPVDVLSIVNDQINSFETRKVDLLSEVENRIKELEGLKASALSTAENVNDLLSLKQQQASVVQAYEAMKQGEETVSQGKAIMVFTVMTILFLPLSFMSSLFGMNAVELTGSDPSPDASDSSRPVPDEIVSFWPITFKRQILIMFTVSFGAVLAVIIPAFSPFARAAIGSALRYAAARSITVVPLYRFWLGRGWSSRRLRARTGAAVRDLKHAVREAVKRQRLEESEVRDGVRASPGTGAAAVGGVPGARSRQRWAPSRGKGDAV
ncbi:hypothetical protein N8I77_003954 [Diaporthe amygdali]|uniref:Uncharacterized protein n=1 Tax=Phomopsis amygdali TaxID=1214568 RepID=A0AAD9SLA2_PHOAM|nr:hypothetical protein N8I77_003954 [Diaporthe amygdali]